MTAQLRYSLLACFLMFGQLAQALTSDDFNDTALDGAVWTVVDPVGDGTVSVNGTQLLIDVPAGTSHDVWSSGNEAVRVMQPTSDTDFGIEVKFESTVNTQYQLQGLLVEQDADDFIRVDFYSDGTRVRAFAATFSNGSPNVRSNISLGTLAAPLYMRLIRQGNTWTQSYSTDGINWQTLTSFSHALVANSVGVFAGNAGSNAPAHTAIVDYVFNTASPIANEDGGGGDFYSLTTGVVGSGTVTRNPDQSVYALDDVVELTAVPDSGWTFDGWSGSVGSIENPLTVTITGDMTIDANFIEAPTPDYSLSTIVQGNGSINVNPAGGTYPEGTSLELTAVPDAGWAFTGWSGALTGMTNPATLILTQDETVTATFEADTTAPVISNVSVNAGQTSAIVTWTTDDPSSSVVDYGTDTSYSLGSISDANFVQSHSVTLDGLTGGGTYHLQITATNTSGLVSTSSDVTFTTASDPSGIVSDDFNDTALDGAVWTVVDPVGDGTVSVNGTQLLIDVPASTSHDVWSSGNEAVRVMQPTSDTDFGIEVKFESTVNTQYQLQGLLVEQDADDFIRVDFYSDGTRVRAFAATFSNGSPNVRSNISLGTLAAPLYMRLIRQGNTWTQSYSTDGINWQTLTSFSHALVANSVGVFAGNAGSNAPAHTAIVDYVFNTASPIANEDGGGGDFYSLTTGVVGSGTVTRNPDQSVYALDDVVELTAVPDSGWTFDGWSGSVGSIENPLTVTITGDMTIDANFIEAPTPDYSLSTIVQGNGSINVNPAGGTYPEGTSLELTAVPDAGWAFTGWSGALTGMTNPATLILTQDETVTATFEADTTAPVISNVSVNAGQTSAIVTWTTDDPSSSVVDYGTDTSYSLGSISDANFVQSHSVTLDGLTGGGTYHLQITATNTSGLVSTSSDVTFTTASDPSGIVSDDFNDTALDGAVWTVVDPVGDGTVSVNGTQLLIDVPAGTSHDVWSSGNEAVRVMQPTSDTDFGIEVKFESTVNTQYQLQGLLVEQDADDFIRVDFYSDGTRVRAFAATFSNGSPNVRSNISLGTLAAPLYMRLIRQGNTWTQSYSTDGINWQTLTSFSHALVANSVGVFAGNAGSSAPAHTAIVNYFFNTASPIAAQQFNVTTSVVGEGSVTLSPSAETYPEDAVLSATAVADAGWEFTSWDGLLTGTKNPETLTVTTDGTVTALFDADTTPPTMSNVSAVTESDETVTVSWATNEPTTGFVCYGTTLNYESGCTAVTSLELSHAVTIYGLTTGEEYQFAVTAEDRIGLTTTSENDSFVVTLAPIVDVWYGDSQKFGQVGNPQRWVNIVGNVSDPDGVAALSYSLNGSSYAPLSMGPFRRLSDSGDFNVEIDYTALLDGANSLQLLATDTQGNQSLKSITIDYTAGQVWPLPYSVDWGAVVDIGDVAQVVDGLWTTSTDGLRNTRMRYDRTLAIGDVTWTDYEVTVPVTIQAFDPAGFDGVNFRPAVGVLLKWPGHTNWTGEQPSWGYYPGGGGAWYEFLQLDGSGRLSLRDFEWNFSATDPQQRSLQVGATYIWKVRVETQPDGSSLYQMKVWPEGSQEPSTWELSGVDSNDVNGGGLLLVAHFTDVLFGDVTISPL